MTWLMSILSGHLQGPQMYAVFWGRGLSWSRISDAQCPMLRCKGKPRSEVSFACNFHNQRSLFLVSLLDFGVFHSNTFSLRSTVRFAVGSLRGFYGGISSWIVWGHFAWKNKRKNPHGHPWQTSQCSRDHKGYPLWVLVESLGVDFGANVWVCILVGEFGRGFSNWVLLDFVCEYFAIFCGRHQAAESHDFMKTLQKSTPSIQPPFSTPKAYHPGRNYYKIIP